MPFQPKPASRVSILGRTGSGKTVLSKNLQALYNRVVIVDLVKDFKPDGRTHFFRTYQDFAEFILRYQHNPNFKLVFQFDLHDRNFLATAEEIFALCYDLGNCLVSVDECQYFDNSHYLRQLILVARRNNVATLCSTQRPANLSKDVISQSSDVFVGKLFETNDIKYLKNFLPDEDIDSVIHLEPFTFLHYRPGEKSELIKPVLMD